MADDVKAEPGRVVDLTEGSELTATAEVGTQPVEERAPTARKVFAVTLAILAMISLVLAMQAAWVRATIQDEDRFVETFQPLAGDEAVATAVSTRIADGIVSSEEYQAFVADRLPEGLEVLATPIASATHQVVVTATTEIIESDAFADAWSAALRGTHVAVSALLTGNDAALVSEGGVVSIDLNELAVVVIDRVEQARGIDLPDIEADLGSIVIYESDELAEAQTTVEAVNRGLWIWLGISLLLIGAALWVARDKRWMVAFLGFGTAAFGLLNLVFWRFAQGRLLEGAADEVAREAIDSAFDIGAAGLRSVTWALIVFGLMVGFLAWVNGPSRRAQGIRATVTGTVDDWKRTPESEPSGLERFLANWKRLLQIVVVLLGLGYLVLGPLPSAVSVLVTAVVVIGIVVLIEVVAGAAEAPEPAAAREKVDA